MKTLLTCTVNGEERAVLADTRDTLLELLRERLGLTGTKEGCSNGNCGTCTVLMDGAPVNRLPGAGAGGAGPRIPPSRACPTAPGSTPSSRPSSTMAARNAASARRASCSPAKALLDANPRPTDADIRHAIAGNLCRCTGYGKIVEAIAGRSPPQRRGR
jgi:carbon-monoxide dehydrogenase small subunit